MNDDSMGDMSSHLDQVAFNIAMEYIAHVFTGLRNAGISRQDAAYIVATMLVVSNGSPPEEKEDQ